MKRTVCILLLLLVTGCGSFPKESQVTYYFDERTEICFAFFEDNANGLLTNGKGLACVPCTEEVLNLVDLLP